MTKACTTAEATSIPFSRSTTNVHTKTVKLDQELDKTFNRATTPASQLYFVSPQSPDFPAILSGGRHISLGKKRERVLLSLFTQRTYTMETRLVTACLCIAATCDVTPVQTAQTNTSTPMVTSQFVCAAAIGRLLRQLEHTHTYLLDKTPRRI